MGRNKGTLDRRPGGLYQRSVEYCGLHHKYVLHRLDQLTDISLVHRSGKFEVGPSIKLYGSKTFRNKFTL